MSFGMYKRILLGRILICLFYIILFVVNSFLYRYCVDELIKSVCGNVSPTFVDKMNSGFLSIVICAFFNMFCIGMMLGIKNLIQSRFIQKIVRRFYRWITLQDVKDNFIKSL